ncbi:TrmJ/YjtD family RNA methyltransferase [Pelagerythrobacter sp.]|uniref:TrmJ/YjtD family RNA methyltransferase n=1 Tax=Pelagerythrobacter sp. TaxID=2800702 RepID=UPI0035AE88C8
MAEDFYAYMLRCADGSYYVGHTDDLEPRIEAHQNGSLGGYTARRRPVELVWSADFPTRDEAFEAERKIKGWSRAKKQALIRGDWAAVQRLAKRHRSFETKPQPAASASPQDERAGRICHITPAHPEEGLKPQAESPSRRAASEMPIIVLVRPQLGENIGKAARAMLNFGLTEMRLVAPRDGWPNPKAGPAAAGADAVLENAAVHDTLADAVADCAHVYATTVRKRGVTKPVVTPEEAAAQIAAAEGRSALVFGPERSGLETDDVALARAILTVPINPEFGSLNLAQAVILCAYEWSKTRDLVQPTSEDLLPPASQDELEGMIAQLETMLEPRGYFLPESRAASTRRTLRTMLTKPGWNHLEVRTMRGVLSSLERRPREN